MEPYIPSCTAGPTPRNRPYALSKARNWSVIGELQKASTSAPTTSPPTRPTAINEPRRESFDGISLKNVMPPTNERLPPRMNPPSGDPKKLISPDRRFNITSADRLANPAAPTPNERREPRASTLAKSTPAPCTRSENSKNCRTRSRMMGLVVSWDNKKARSASLSAKTPPSPKYSSCQFSPKASASSSSLQWPVGSVSLKGLPRTQEYLFSDCGFDGSGTSVSGLLHRASEDHLS